MDEKLLSLKDLAERLGLTYKSLYNRINHKTGQITIAGRTCPIRKDRNQWLIWESEFLSAKKTPEPQAELPSKATTKRGRPPKRDWAISFKNLGTGE